jgi:5-(carboxyamino)imidazole ribonucleotide synthase
MPDSDRPRTLVPGATVGMIGGGQLGRMFASAAKRCGYRVHVFGDPATSPAGQLSDRVWDISLDDLDAVREFARTVDVISYEFENIPVATVEAAAELTPVFPGAHLLAASQHRLREKTTLRSFGIPTTDFLPVVTIDDLASAVDEFGGGILKTATMGYDGKGQAKVGPGDDLRAAWNQLNRAESILERFVDFDFEISVVAARFADGTSRAFEPMLNHHVDHILDLSISPSPQVTEKTANDAKQMAVAILERFDVYGVLCVEFFVTKNGDVVVNEIAPRTHNSGHLTIEACGSSQFEQQLRAICGLPSGSTRQTRPAAMANLLGDHILDADASCWRKMFAIPNIHVHLYGKSEARIGRKMGHLTCVAETAESAARQVLEARAILSGDA